MGRGGNVGRYDVERVDRAHVDLTDLVDIELYTE
jgi:hypothetical protein